MTEKNNTSPKSAISHRPLIAVSVMFILLIGACAGYFQYQIQTYNAAHSTLRQNVDQVNKNIQSLVRQDGAKGQQINDLEKKINGVNTQIDFLTKSLQQIPGADSTDWKLAEVEYLLRLGNQRVALQQEPEGGAALLQAADKILTEIDDPGLLQVRALIADELLALGQVADFDNQGVYLALQSLKKNISTAIFTPTSFKKLATEDNLDASIEATESHATEHSFMTQFKGLFEFRRQDKSFEAPLTHQQLQILKHSLTLMIEQAQWASLKGDQELFVNSLKQVEKMVRANLRHKAAEEFASSIVPLYEIKVNPKMPDISRSLRRLRKLLDQRIYQPINQEPSQ